MNPRDRTALVAVGFSLCVGCTMRRLVWILCIAAISACSAEDVEEICDGSDHLRLGVRSLPQYGRIMYGEAVEVENGRSFLFVDGECRFWARGPDQRYGGATTGELDGPTAYDLSKDLRYGSIDEMAGLDVAPGFDMSTTVIHNETAVMGCTGTCGSEFKETVRLNACEWLARLGDQGTPMAAPIRYRLVPASEANAETGRVYEWPFDGPPPAEAVLTDAETMPDEPGQSVKIVDEPVLDRLREIQDQRQEEVDNDTYYGGTAFVERPAEGEIYYLYMRSSLPLEEDDGLIPMPPAPD